MTVLCYTRKIFPIPTFGPPSPSLGSGDDYPCHVSKRDIATLCHALKMQNPRQTLPCHGVTLEIPPRPRKKNWPTPGTPFSALLPHFNLSPADTLCHRWSPVDTLNLTGPLRSLTGHLTGLRVKWGGWRVGVLRFRPVVLYMVVPHLSTSSHFFLLAPWAT